MAATAHVDAQIGEPAQAANVEPDDAALTLLIAVGAAWGLWFLLRGRFGE